MWPAQSAAETVTERKAVAGIPLIWMFSVENNVAKDEAWRKSVAASFKEPSI
jgi:hypothetical protein